MLGLNERRLSLRSAAQLRQNSAPSSQHSRSSSSLGNQPKKQSGPEKHNSSHKEYDHHDYNNDCCDDDDDDEQPSSPGDYLDESSPLHHDHYDDEEEEEEMDEEEDDEEEEPFDAAKAALLARFHYSARYYAGDMEYRHVIMPKEYYSNYVSENFKNRLLREEEWRHIGITQSLGWEHYELHGPEPHIFLFRRKRTDQ